MQRLLLLSTLFLAILQGSEAKVKPATKPRKAKFPSFSDILNVAMDVMVEDWGEKLKEYEPTPGFKEHLKDGKMPV
jgi:hypothetical protein